MKKYIFAVVLLALCGGLFAQDRAPTEMPSTYVKKKQWKNVKDYGAKGDNSTLDDAAFLAAITAAGDKGNVFVPDGTFLLSDTIALGDSMILCGVGVASVIKAESGHNENIITITGKTGVVIRDLMIDGNKANNGSGGFRSAIIFEGCTDFMVSNVKIVNMYGQSIGVGTEGNPSDGGIIEYCTISGGTSGHIDVNSSRNVSMLYNKITGTHNDEDGIFLGHGKTNGHLALGNEIDSCNRGIVLDNTVFVDSTPEIRNIRLIGNYVSVSQASGISLYGAQHCVLANNVCIANNRDVFPGGHGSGIYLADGNSRGSSYNLIVGNICYDTTASKLQTFGLCITGLADSNTILANNFGGNLIITDSLAGSHNIFATYADTSGMLQGNLWISSNWTPEIRTYNSSLLIPLMVKADSVQFKFVEQNGRLKFWAGDSAFSIGIPFEIAGPEGLNLPYIYMWTDTTHFRGNVIIDSPLTLGAVTYPIVDGTVDQVITTNGSGVASWNTQFGAGGGEANTIQDTGVYNDTEGFGLSGGKAGVDLHVKGLIEGSNITIAKSGDSALTIAASGGGLTYWTESDDNDTSVFTATGPNTTVGLNDNLTMQGNNITGVGSVLSSSYTAVSSPGHVWLGNSNDSVYLVGFAYTVLGQNTDPYRVASWARADSAAHDTAEVVRAEIKDTGDVYYQPLEATLTDIADGIIDENLDNTINPWADNEIASSGDWNTAYGWGDHSGQNYLDNDDANVDTATWNLDNSAGLAAALDDETGTGLAVFGTQPTFTTDITSPLVIGGTATTSDLSLKTTSGVGATGADMHFLVGDNGATEAVTILNNGNVGIGTATPSSITHIKGNTAGTVGSHPAGQIIIQNPANDVNSAAVICGYESDAGGAPDQQLWYLGSSSSSNQDITFLNRRNAPLSLGTNGITRMTIDDGGNSGNVGIGTSSPSEKLSVVGNIATGDTTTGDVDVWHYFSTNGSWTTEKFGWNDGNAQFELSDDFDVTGNISVSGTVDGIDVSKLDSTLDGYPIDTATAGGSNNLDDGDILEWNAANSEWRPTAQTGGGWNWTDSTGFLVGWGGVAKSVVNDTNYFRFEGGADFDTTGGSVSLADDAVDPVVLKDSNVQAQGDIVTVAASSEFGFKTVSELALMEDEDINTFAELQSWVSGKTLLNEEDAATIDVGWTFAGLLSVDSTNTDHLVSSNVYLGNDTLKGVDVLVVDTIVVDGDVIKDFTGTNLSVTAGVLNAAGGASEWDETDDTKDSLRWIAPCADTGIVIEVDAAGNVFLTVGNESDNSASTLRIKADTVELGGDIISEFAGTGLTVTSNELTADLGTSIADGEIDANTIDTSSMAHAPLGKLIRDTITGEGYITGNESITLSGDVSGSGATAITTTIGADKLEFGMVDNSITLAGDPALGASEAWFGTTGIIFEGATANLIEGLLTVSDLTTTDKTWTLQDVTGTIYQTGGTDVAVADGGTGTSGPLTDGGILLGGGSGAITALGVATNGQIPVGDGTTDPVLATITGTASEVTVTNGAGTITLSLPNDAGTDISVDLEEESHASEHEDAGDDEIAVTAGMMNTGTNASSATYWRGDNTWETPAAGGNTIDSALSLTDVAGGNQIVYWDTDTLYVSDTTAGTDNVTIKSNDRLIILPDTLIVSGNITVPNNSISDEELDEGATLDWTGTHTFSNNTYLDDGTGDSPVLILVDEDNNYVTLQKFDAGASLLSNNEGQLQFSFSGDGDDFIIMDMFSANVPMISTIGDCDLVLNSSSGEISFGDENLTTTGTLDAGATSVTGNIAVTGTVDGVDVGNLNTDVAADSGSWNATADALGTAIDSTKTTDGSMSEADLTISNAPTDEYVVTWEADAGTGGQMTWEERAGGGEANTLSDTGTFNGTEGFGLAGGKTGVALKVKGLIEGTSVTITASGDSAYTIAASGAGLTYWAESENGDTSLWTAAGGNTELGMNDNLSMRGNNIVDVGTVDTVDVAALAAKVHKDTSHFIFAFSNPNAVYDTDSLLCIKPVTEKAITITRIDVTCDADPTTEPAMKLNHTDNFISRTSPTDIDVITTTNGVTTITSGFDDATIPATRCIYFAFTADPIAAIKSITVDVTYTID